MSPAVTGKRVVARLYRDWRAVPFAWSSADCLTFAGLAAEQITGTDPGRALRKRYSSETGARRVMVNEGWGDMGDVAASLLSEIHPSQARSGDWAHVVDERGRDCIGVVCGHQIAVRAETGMSYVPLTRALRAFEVR